MPDIKLQHNGPRVGNRHVWGREEEDWGGARSGEQEEAEIDRCEAWGPADQLRAFRREAQRSPRGCAGDPRQSEATSGAREGRAGSAEVRRSLLPLLLAAADPPRPPLPRPGRWRSSTCRTRAARWWTRARTRCWTRWRRPFWWLRRRCCAARASPTLCPAAPRATSCTCRVRERRHPGSYCGYHQHPAGAAGGSPGLWHRCTTRCACESGQTRARGGACLPAL